MPPEVSTVIVTSRVALEDAVSSAVEKAVRALRPPPADTGAPGIGWLTNKQAQHALGVSKPTLSRWRKDGTLPYSKVGGSVYYSTSDIETLLSGRRVRSSARQVSV